MRGCVLAYMCVRMCVCVCVCVCGGVTLDPFVGFSQQSHHPAVVHIFDGCAVRCIQGGRCHRATSVHPIAAGAVGCAVVQVTLLQPAAGLC